MARRRSRKHYSTGRHQSNNGRKENTPSKDTARDETKTADETANSEVMNANQAESSFADSGTSMEASYNPDFVMLDCPETTEADTSIIGNVEVGSTPASERDLNRVDMEEELPSLSFEANEDVRRNDFAETNKNLHAEKLPVRPDGEERKIPEDSFILSESFVSIESLSVSSVDPTVEEITSCSASSQVEEVSPNQNPNVKVEKQEVLSQDIASPSIEDDVTRHNQVCFNPDEQQVNTEASGEGPVTPDEEERKILVNSFSLSESFVAIEPLSVSLEDPNVGEITSCIDIAMPNQVYSNADEHQVNTKGSGEEPMTPDGEERKTLVDSFILSASFVAVESLSVSPEDPNVKEITSCPPSSQVEEESPNQSEFQNPDVRVEKQKDALSQNIVSSSVEDEVTKPNQVFSNADEQQVNTKASGEEPVTSDEEGRKILVDSLILGESFVAVGSLSSVSLDPNVGEITSRSPSSQVEKASPNQSKFQNSDAGVEKQNVLPPNIISPNEGDVTEKNQNQVCNSDEQQVNAKAGDEECINKDKVENSTTESGENLPHTHDQAVEPKEKQVSETSVCEEPAEKFLETSICEEPAEEFPETSIREEPAEEFPETSICEEPAEKFPETSICEEPAKEFPETSICEEPAEEFPETSICEEPAEEFPETTICEKPVEEFPETSICEEPAKEFPETSICEEPAEEFPETSICEEPAKEFPETSICEEAAEEFPETSICEEPAKEFPETSICEEPAKEFPETSICEEPEEKFPETSICEEPAEEFPETSICEEPAEEFPETSICEEPAKEFPETSICEEPAEEFPETSKCYSADTASRDDQTSNESTGQSSEKSARNKNFLNQSEISDPNTSNENQPRRQINPGTTANQAVSEHVSVGECSAESTEHEAASVHVSQGGLAEETQVGLLSSQDEQDSEQASNSSQDEFQNSESTAVAPRKISSTGVTFLPSQLFKSYYNLWVLNTPWTLSALEGMKIAVTKIEMFINACKRECVKWSLRNKLIEQDASWFERVTGTIGFIACNSSLVAISLIHALVITVTRVNLLVLMKQDYALKRQLFNQSPSLMVEVNSVKGCIKEVCRTTICMVITEMLEKSNVSKQLKSKNANGSSVADTFIHKLCNFVETLWSGEKETVEIFRDFLVDNQPVLEAYMAALKTLHGSKDLFKSGIWNVITNRGCNMGCKLTDALLVFQDFEYHFLLHKQVDGELQSNVVPQIERAIDAIRKEDQDIKRMVKEMGII